MQPVAAAAGAVAPALLHQHESVAHTTILPHSNGCAWPCTRLLRALLCTAWLLTPPLDLLSPPSRLLLLLQSRPRRAAPATAAAARCCWQQGTSAALRPTAAAAAQQRPPPAR
jgi:hypothetical protein